MQSLHYLCRNVNPNARRLLENASINFNYLTNYFEMIVVNHMLT